MFVCVCVCIADSHLFLSQTVSWIIVCTASNVNQQISHWNEGAFQTNRQTIVWNMVFFFRFAIILTLVHVFKMSDSWAGASLSIQRYANIYHNTAPRKSLKMIGKDSVFVFVRRCDLSRSFTNFWRRPYIGWVYWMHDLQLLSQHFNRTAFM